jgi:hypothetical protein
VSFKTIKAAIESPFVMYFVQKEEVRVVELPWKKKGRR